MKKIIFGLAVSCWSGIALAQYVSNTLQQRIENDKASIVLDNTDIQARQADIDSIVKDQLANQVTSQVPDVIAIQNSQANAVVDNAISL